MNVLQIASANMPFFAEQVRILEEHGIDCDIVYATSRDTEEHGVAEGPATTILNSIYGHNPLYYAVRGLSFYPAVLHRALRRDYDVVHVNSGMVAPIAQFQPNRPIVTTLWGDDLLSERLYGFQTALTRWCATRSSATIVRTEAMAEALPCSAYIIPSGIDLEKFTPMDQSEALETVGWDPNASHVMFPYHPTQSKKRYPLAQEIVAHLNDRIDTAVELQVVSGVPHDQMPYYYNAADALLLPSLREGSPNTVKEAMACNIPVVSTDVGDVRDLLSPVSNSHVCPRDTDLASALASVLASDERSNGRDHVRPLSLERMSERIIEIYRTITR